MILIGADFVPTELNASLFVNGDIHQLMGNALCDLLSKSDYRIFNLEVPLTDVLSPIPKEGPNLSASTNTICAYKKIGTNLLVLANNHILDQDFQGLTSTINLLDKNNISHVGAGESLLEASMPFFFDIAGKIYCVYACAEHEFSIAETGLPGANPFDPLESYDHVTEAKKKCDYLIVLYHGGKEEYRYPSPNLQKICRKFIEKGANLVVCQHSHCIGCEENYQSGKIIYGQGNFLFNRVNNEYWHSSLLIGITDQNDIVYYPIVQSYYGIMLAETIEAKEIIGGFHHRSNEIKETGFISDKYETYAQNFIDNYILYILKKNYSLFYRVLNKLSGHKMQKITVSRTLSKIHLGLRNYIECEAHREMFIAGIVSFSKKKDEKDL